MIQLFGLNARFEFVLRLCRIIKKAACSIAVLGFAAILSSCSQGLFPLDPPALKARGLQSGEGYVVATFREQTRTRSGKPATVGASASVRVRGTGGLAKGAVVTLVPQVMPFNRNPYLAGGGSPSEVIAIPVPVGDYEITGWNMVGLGTSGPVSVVNRKPMKVPFQVKPNEATYIGSFQSVAIIGRNLLGFPIFVDGFITAKDDFVKDQSRIAKEYPSIKRTDIEKSKVPEIFVAESKRISESGPSFFGF